MTSNVKNAPAGRYFVEIIGSDRHTWVCIGDSTSGKTLKLREVVVMADPDWKNAMISNAGVFAAHVSNQQDQTWIFLHVDEYEIRVRKDSRGRWVCKGRVFVETPDGPRHFHDYNF